MTTSLAAVFYFCFLYTQVLGDVVTIHLKISHNDKLAEVLNQQTGQCKQDEELFHAFGLEAKVERVLDANTQLNVKIYLRVRFVASSVGINHEITKGWRLIFYHGAIEQWRADA